MDFQLREQYVGNFMWYSKQVSNYTDRVFPNANCHLHEFDDHCVSDPISLNHKPSCDGSMFPETGTLESLYFTSAVGWMGSYMSVMQ